MSLKERLFDDLKTAMKEKDAIKKEVIQMVRAGVLQVEKDNKIESLDDSGVLTVISKEIKKYKTPPSPPCILPHRTLRPRLGLLCRG